MSKVKEALSNIYRGVKESFPSRHKGGTMSKAEGCERSEAISNKEESMPKSKIDEAVEKEITKEGLPKEAFAIVGDPEDPETWKLPHHTKAILRALRGRIDIETKIPTQSGKTVNWDRMPAAVAALSPGGYRGERVQASDGEIIQAARHLARHYENAGKPVPPTLGVLT